MCELARVGKTALSFSKLTVEQTLKLVNLLKNLNRKETLTKFFNRRLNEGLELGNQAAPQYLRKRLLPFAKVGSLSNFTLEEAELLLKKNVL